MSREISESYRYIVRSPDVRGGNARVEGTRIAVHDVIGLLQNGEIDQDVPEDLTHLLQELGRQVLRLRDITSPEATDPVVGGNPSSLEACVRPA